MDDTLAGRAIHAFARLIALLGGAALIIVMFVTVISIIGRTLIPLGLSPIPGDFEIVQAGMLFAVFAFLPWCHLTRSNAMVAILTDRFPVRITASLEFIWDIVMLVASSFILWRLYAGLVDKYAFRESTFILRVPIWTIYAAGMVGATVFVLIAVYCAIRSGQNAFSREPLRPVGGGSE